jgi:cyclopropane fatty-acyl-phospholipid synthase-like methyltransferase
MGDGPAYYYRFSGMYSLHLEIPPFAGWVARNHVSLQRALPAIDAGSRVLEIGGGIGRLSRLLALRYPDCPVTSIDASAEMTRRAQAADTPENLSFLTRSFWDMEEDFDLVVCAGCWEFFEREPSAEKLVALLSPGGTAVLNTLAPAPFSRVRERLFRRVWGTKMWLHTPDALATALRARGCMVRWENVNRTEGSYTITAIRGD